MQIVEDPPDRVEAQEVDDALPGLERDPRLRELRQQRVQRPAQVLDLPLALLPRPRDDVVRGKTRIVGRPVPQELRLQPVALVLERAVLELAPADDDRQHSPARASRR